MISLVLTCLNERDSIGELLDSIQQQRIVPHEVVIVDGGSTDGTLDIIKNHPLSHSRKFGLIVISDPKFSLAGGSRSPVAAGRNEAIRNCSGDCVIVTDGGCKLDPFFVVRMMEVIAKNMDSMVFGRTHEVCTTALHHAITVISGEQRHSSRAVGFHRYLWEMIGGYPEVSLTAEDTLFNKRLQDAGIPFVIAEKAVVYWKPRDTVKSILKQSYRYAKGDGINALRFAMYAKKLLKWGIIL